MNRAESKLWHYLTDRYQGRLHHIVVDTVLALCVIALLIGNVILAFWLHSFFVPPQFTVQITVPKEIISDTTLPVTIHYTNGSKSISDVKLQLYPPAGFKVKPLQSLTQHFETILANTADAYTITGRFNGEVKQTYRFIAIYHYRYYGQQYNGLAYVDFKVDTSSLEVVPELPQQVLNSDIVNWTINYTNNSDQSRQHSCIVLHVPKKFSVQTSSLPISGGKTIRLPKVIAHQHGSVVITGNFQGTVGEGSQLLSATVYDQCSGANYQQVSINSPITVLVPHLQLATSGPSLANVGDVLRYTVRYTNTGNTVLRNVVVTSQLNHFAGHYSKLIVPNGRLVGDTITWTDATIQPHETHVQTFTVYTKRNLREKNLSFSYTTHAQALIDDIQVSTHAAAVTSQITKFNSTLNFTTSYQYSSTTGEQLGYGPYPLQANNITALRVFWEIKDFTNNLSGVTIQTILPSQVDWADYSVVTAGSDIHYNPTTRMITWHVNTIPSFAHPQGASFELRIKPNTLQIGKKINITNETQFSARDWFTNSLMKRNSGALRVNNPVIAATD